jgi:hypothetical protein
MHITKMLIPYAVNKVINTDDINNIVLKRLIISPRALAYYREQLKEIDKDYEILVPYYVDDELKQIKRHIQYRYGMDINMTVIYKTHYYQALFNIGKPKLLLEQCGFTLWTDRELKIINKVLSYSDFKSVPYYLKRGLIRTANNKGITVDELLDSKLLERIDSLRGDLC